MNRILNIKEQNLCISKLKKLEKIKIKKKNTLIEYFDNKFLNYQAQIYFNSFLMNKKKIEKNSILFSSHFENSFFPKNNLGNFYKQNKEYKKAIKHYLSALKKKDDLLNLSIDIKKSLILMRRITHATIITIIHCGNPL